MTYWDTVHDPDDMNAIEKVLHLKLPKEYRDVIQKLKKKFPDHAISNGDAEFYLDSNYLIRINMEELKKRYDGR